MAEERIYTIVVKRQRMEVSKAAYHAYHQAREAERYTFATRALALGMNLNTLADTLGHAQPSTTLNMYSHSLDEQKKREMSKFNQKP